MMKQILFFGLLSCLSPLVNAETIKVSSGGSIQDALDKAQPGDTVSLADGKYDGFISVRDGEKDARITISGSRDAIVNGGKSSRMIEINHSYHTLDGFTVDGKTGSGSKSEDYIDKCVYVLGTKKPEVIRANGEEYESSLDGMLIENMFITNCGGECMRLRSFITNAEVSGNHFKGCGVHDFKFPSSTVNGEVIYVGTSSNQWEDGKNSRGGPDLTKHIWIHHNEMISQGNECCDVKEGTTDVLVEYNVCSEQKDPNSAGLDSRTDDVIFRYNEVFDCDGAGVRIGGHTIDGKTYGLNNEVYGNVFGDNKYAAIKIETGEDHNMCQNECKGECVIRGSTSDGFQDVVGSCSKNREITWATESGVVTEKPVIEIEIDSAKEEFEEDKEGDDKKKDSDDSDDSDSEDDRRLNDVRQCAALRIKSVKASAHDGNVPKNAIDGKAVTRWSANKKGAWLELTLSGKSEVNSIEMSFFRGDSRQQFFDLYADGKPVLMHQKASGKTLNLQRFLLKEPIVAQKLTIFGQGNSKNSWNSISDIIVCGSSTSETHDVPNEEEECETFPLEIAEVKSSSDDGNKALNVLDRDLKTRWSCKKSPCELLLTLKEPVYIAEFEFAVYQGNLRKQNFDLEVNTPSGWQDVIVDGVSENTKGLQSIDVDIENVSQIKFIGYGNDKNNWSSIVSVDAVGC